MLINKKPTELKLLLLVAAIYFIWGTMSLYQGKPKIDEAANHLPVLLGMYEQGYLNYILNDNYEAANTPLPYLPPLLISKLINTQPNLYIARTCNFIFSFLTIWLFISIYRKLSNDKVDYSVLIFVFYPYFLKPSFTFYITLFGVLFLFLTIYLLQSQVKYRELFGGIAAAAGILSQQFIVALPVAYTVAKWIDRKDVEGVHKSKRMSKSYAIFFIPLVIPAVLFILWGGLTHPKWQIHNPKFDMTHITALFTITGGVLFPYVLEKIRWEKRFIIIGVIALILTYFFSPGHAVKGDYGLVTGYTFHFLEIVKSLSPILSFAFQFLLCTAGMYVFYILRKEIKSDTVMILYYTAVILVIIFAFNTIFSERHLLPLIACLLLLALPRIQSIWIKRMWISFQVIFGSVYFYYWIFETANY